jgi:four helix bundle protein
VTSEQYSNPKVKDFYDLIAWQQSADLTVNIYQLTKSFPSKEKFSLIDQLRRASTSICANIAEGFGRFSYKDRIHFYHQSRGSLKEIQSFLLIAKKLGYTHSEDLIKQIWEQTKTVEKLINGLIKSSETLKKK